MIRRARQVDRTHRGFTLVETLASLLVFTLVTLGVVPLLLSATRGATLSRSFTVGKNLSLQAMERVRGLPYFVSYANQPKLVDVLDFYYPNATGAVTGVFTTTCTSATTDNPACPDNIGAGYTVTYAAEFIAPGPLDAAGKETFVNVVPPSTYTRTSSPADIPPTRLVRIKVETTWDATGAARRYALTSFFGERNLAEEKIRGVGRVDYAVEVLTSYVDNDPAGRVSDLVVNAGSAESRVQTRTLSEADQTVRSAALRLARPPDAGSATDTGLNLSLLGANSFIHAAPDQDPAAGSTRVAQTLNHPELDLKPQIAYLSTSGTGGPLRVKTANDLPLASGTFNLNDLASLDTYDLWVNNQADTTMGALLRLDPTSPVFSVRPRTAAEEDLATKVLSGGTSATTVGGATKKVDAAASAELGQIRLFPVTFILTGEKSVIVVDNVTSSVSCSASATGATQDASYSASLRYWKETNENDGIQEGSYQPVTLSGTTDNLPGVGNPMVYEDPVSALSYGSELDVYLFPVPHEHSDPVLGTVTHKHAGYLTDWQNIPTTFTSEDAGRVSRARIDGAIRINTRPSNPTIPQTGLNISIAKLSCEAVDRR
ncbi:MAG: type II secretion system GspH family protein [Actinomycetota bacterium]|nr:type II secretion system GspH family protein [Actinomycetota bacterium]